MVFPPGCGFEATDAARRVGGELALGGCRSCIIRRLSGGRLGYPQSPRFRCQLWCERRGIDGIGGYLPLGRINNLLITLES